MFGFPLWDGWPHLENHVFDHCFRYFQGLSSFEWRFPSLRVGIIPMESLEAGMGVQEGPP